MTRRKGEVTDKQRNLSHPYQVELVAPLGRGYDIMSRWAAWHDHVTTSGSRSMCWCFRRPEVADAFAMDFGGRRIDRPVPPHYVEADLPDAKELERRAKGARVGLDIVMGGR